jgi:hypothetical protein
MIYNFERHISLLQISEDLKNQGKSLYKENLDQALELSSYNSQLSLHILWENYMEPFLLMRNFLNKKIDGQEFCNEVMTLRSKHISDTDKFLSKLVSGEVKEFCPDKNSYKLNGFLTSLFCACENFDENYETEKFKTCIESHLWNFNQAFMRE